MITPHWLPLHIRRNDNPWRHRINIIGPDCEPLDMRGYHGRMQIRFYEGQPDDPVAALSKEVGTTFSDGSPYSDGTVHMTTDSGNSSRINFDKKGFEIVITSLDLLRFPFFGPQLPIIRFSYDILICKTAGVGTPPYSAADPQFDENAWFEGTVDFHNGVSDPDYEPRRCPTVYDDFPEEYHLECRRGIGDVCSQFGRLGCLWHEMPRNVPTEVLRRQIWPDAA